MVRRTLYLSIFSVGLHQFWDGKIANTIRSILGLDQGLNRIIILSEG